MKKFFVLALMVLGSGQANADSFLGSITFHNTQIGCEGINYSQVAIYPVFGGTENWPLFDLSIEGSPDAYFGGYATFVVSSQLLSDNGNGTCQFDLTQAVYLPDPVIEEPIEEPIELMTY